jgi:hypothetical protein
LLKELLLRMMALRKYFLQAYTLAVGGLMIMVLFLGWSNEADASAWLAAGLAAGR